jgi:hypothetical protein
LFRPRQLCVEPTHLWGEEDLRIQCQPIHFQCLLLGLSRSSKQICIPRKGKDCWPVCQNHLQSRAEMLRNRPQLRPQAIFLRHQLIVRRDQAQIQLPEDSSDAKKHFRARLSDKLLPHIGYRVARILWVVLCLFTMYLTRPRSHQLSGQSSSDH